MKKKILLMLMAIFFVLCALGFASCGSSKGLSYELTSSGTSYIVTGIGTCTDTDIVIPSSYNKLPVTEIGSEAFYENKTITSVVIPKSVESIGEKAFAYCRFTSVTIGSGVTSIGYDAFANCSGLSKVTIGKNVTRIEGGAFANCSELTSVNFKNRQSLKIAAKINVI